MKIEQILGMTFEEVVNKCDSYIESVNHVAKIISLKRISCNFDNDFHDCILYFDLVNGKEMVLCLLKNEYISLIEHIKLRVVVMKRYGFNKNFKCNITYTSMFSSIVSYVKKDIFNSIHI